jgi:hypothetical protein
VLVCVRARTSLPPSQLCVCMGLAVGPGPSPPPANPPHSHPPPPVCPSLSLSLTHTHTHTLTVCSGNGAPPTPSSDAPTPSPRSHACRRRRRRALAPIHGHAFIAGPRCCPSRGRRPHSRCVYVYYILCIIITKININNHVYDNNIRRPHCSAAWGT